VARAATEATALVDLEVVVHIQVFPHCLLLQTLLRRRGEEVRVVMETMVGLETDLAVVARVLEVLKTVAMEKMVMRE
jgi:hypothetical protein